MLNPVFHEPSGFETRLRAKLNDEIDAEAVAARVETAKPRRVRFLLDRIAEYHVERFAGASVASTARWCATNCRRSHTTIARIDADLYDAIADVIEISGTAR